MSSDEINYRERAARLRAAFHRYMAAQADTEAATARLSEGLRRFAAAVQEASDQELVEHPDLAEVNVFLDGYYDPPTPR